MLRTGMALTGAAILWLSLVAPALAGQPRTVLWVCDVPGEGSVVFVTAAEAARHGITQADAHAGQVFERQFRRGLHRPIAGLPIRTSAGHARSLPLAVRSCGAVAGTEGSPGAALRRMLRAEPTTAAGSRG